MSHLKGMPTVVIDEETEDWCRAHAVTFGPAPLALTIGELAERQRAYRMKWRGPGVAPTPAASGARTTPTPARHTLGSLLLETDRGGDLMSTTTQLDTHWTADDAAYALAIGRSKEQIMAARKLWRDTGGVISNDHVLALNNKLARAPLSAF